MRTKILVVYFSRTGTTKQAAEIIARKLKCGCGEIGDECDIKSHGIIVFGTPVQNAGLPPEVSDFLKGNDLRGVKIYPFFTTGGIYRYVIHDLKSLCPLSRINEPIYIYNRGSGNAVEENINLICSWAEKICAQEGIQ